ncbi:hypothetical protein [Devosia sp. SL43]|nr:hypothetical protein [Devosia sp. SL43]
MPPTEEQKAALRALQADYFRKMAPTWGVAPDEVDAWIEEQVA